MPHDVVALRTSEVARILGVSVDWLRTAENKGKFPRAKRDLINNWRVYTEQDVERLRELLVPSSDKEY